MPESATRTLRESVAGNPEVERLRTEVRDYLQARAVKAVEGLGARLGESVGRLGEGGGLAGPLAEGGKAISEGRSPARALTAAGGAHLKDAVKEKVKGLFSGSGKGRGGGGKSKSVTIVEDIDVGVPVRQAYDQWTRFQEFSTFAKGVVSVEKADDTTSNWKVKVAKSTRSWRANVTEQIPDERIVWTTEGAKGTVKGVVTFHPLTDDLTRVLLVLEYFPKGLVEKTGNIWRAQGRRARLDLKLYRKFVMMRGEDEQADGWRGEIHDGKVTVDHEQAVEDEDGGQDARDRDDEREPQADEAEFTDGADDELPDGEVPEEDLADDEIDEDAEDADLPEDEAEDADLPEDEEEDEDAAEDADLPEEDAEDYGPEDAEDAEPEEPGEPEEEPARRPRRRPATARR